MVWCEFEKLDCLNLFWFKSLVNYCHINLDTPAESHKKVIEAIRKLLSYVLLMNDISDNNPWLYVFITFNLALFYIQSI